MTLFEIAKSLRDIATAAKAKDWGKLLELSGKLISGFGSLVASREAAKLPGPVGHHKEPKEDKGTPEDVDAAIAEMRTALAEAAAPPETAFSFGMITPEMLTKLAKLLNVLADLAKNR